MNKTIYQQTDEWTNARRSEPVRILRLHTNHTRGEDQWQAHSAMTRQLVILWKDTDLFESGQNL